MSVANKILRIPEFPPAVSGLSLVELLVGMAVALAATLVIAQMYANFEGQKRTSVAGSDAQENGLVALYTLERDIRMAGYGLIASPLRTCGTVASYYNGTIPAPGIPNGPLMPVRIIEGGASADTIEITSSASARPGVPVQIRQAMPSSASDLKVDSVTSFNVGDVIVVSDGVTCTLMQITQIQQPASGAALFGFVHAPGQGAFNAPGGIGPAYGVGASVYQLGALSVRRYSVGPSASTQALFVEERLPPAPPAAMVNDIVDVQAQYGITLPAGQQVSCWVDATNGGNTCDPGNWQDPSAADAQRIRAVRLAVLARSSIRERPSSAGGACDATTVAPTWSGGNFNLPVDWQCYRYKVFETVVPLRNVIWGN